MCKLLVAAKKCMIHVHTDDLTDYKPGWYAWDGSDIVRFAVTKGYCITNVLDSFTDKQIDLYNILNKFKFSYGFNVLRASYIQFERRQISVSVPEKKSVIIKPTHVFINEEYIKIGNEKILSGTELLNKYIKWKAGKLDESISSELREALSGDRLSSSKSFTETFRTREKSQDDTLCRISISKSWYIVKK